MYRNKSRFSSCSPLYYNSVILQTDSLACNWLEPHPTLCTLSLFQCPLSCARWPWPGVRLANSIHLTLLGSGTRVCSTLHTAQGRLRLFHRDKTWNVSMLSCQYLCIQLWCGHPRQKGPPQDNQSSYQQWDGTALIQGKIKTAPRNQWGHTLEGWIAVDFLTTEKEEWYLAIAKTQNPERCQNLLQTSPQSGWSRENLHVLFLKGK